ncbi:hypothetical protein K402DRAFT_393239 [Aulographum hederae CBS 113979]|uniref:Protein YOP1 n=1 Tax=Aulographum hederae CBS 113979 TaxID=1176131 RepID=A0A6G1H1I2_9PEZI|nr:hypothetical protein K402DRAFT_393239 [Aulographum hederae CBS 113979]
MLDPVANLIYLMIAVLYPLYASWKCLNKNDPNLSLYWLRYWIVFAVVREAESIFANVFYFVPFYSWLSLLVHGYLVLPGISTQVYNNFIDDFFDRHMNEVEDFFARIQARARESGFAGQYVAKLIDLLFAVIPQSEGRGPAGSTSSYAEGSSMSSYLSKAGNLPVIGNPAAYTEYIGGALGSLWGSKPANDADGKKNE